MQDLATEPDASVMAAEARKLIEMHDGDWDSLHAFVPLHWDGEKFTAPAWYALDTTIDPGDYPKIMMGAAHELLQADPGNPPYAYGLQIEAHISELPASATPQEVAQLADDMAARAIDKRPDARECAAAWVADIHGRLWQARRFRDTDTIEEECWPAMAKRQDLLMASLVSVARATGILAWGLEPSPEEQQAFDAVHAAVKEEAGRG